MIKRSNISYEKKAGGQFYSHLIPNTKDSKEVSGLEKVSENWAALKWEDEEEITLVISQSPFCDWETAMFF